MNTLSILLLILLLGSFFVYSIDSINRKLTGISAFVIALLTSGYFLGTAYNGLTETWP